MYTCRYMHKCEYLYMNILMHIYICMHMYIYLQKYMYMYMHIYVYMYERAMLHVDLPSDSNPAYSIHARMLLFWNEIYDRLIDCEARLHLTQDSCETSMERDFEFLVLLGNWSVPDVVADQRRCRPRDHCCYFWKRTVNDLIFPSVSMGYNSISADKVVEKWATETLVIFSVRFHLPFQQLTIVSFVSVFLDARVIMVNFIQEKEMT